jgi:lipid II isoglutaminyl synthase (glutamine-hydrolysing)
MPEKKMPPIDLRAGTAVVVGRLAGTVSRRLGRGGGTALPGLISETIDPNLLAHLAAQLPRGAIIVTGTNGKTTTSHMLAGILARAGMQPMRNASGSNLARGIATSLASHANLLGRLQTTPSTIGLFETDEAAFGRVVPAVVPRVVVVTNLFRDQLDRYGEVDTVAAVWRQALARSAETRGNAGNRPVPGERERAGDTTGALSGRPMQDDDTLPSLVLNADDPTVASLANPFGQGSTATFRSLYFGIDDTRHGRPGPEHASDAKVCPACGALLAYPVCFYGHLGHYACANGHRRPDPAVVARRLEVRGFEGTDVTLETPLGTVDMRLPLPGIYNVYNALAAAAGALAAGATLKAIKEGLERFTAAFGRLERVPVDGRTVYLVLAKNPVGMNEALRTLFADSQPKHLLMALNDLDADGRDVSWIWDADFEHVSGQASLVIAGRRAEDLALRLKYAGALEEVAGSRRPANGDLRAHDRPVSDHRPADPPANAVWENGLGRAGQGLRLESRLDRALDAALADLPAGESLFAVLTYTAMLELRRVLSDRGYIEPYWERE